MNSRFAFVYSIAKRLLFLMMLLQSCFLHSQNDSSTINKCRFTAITSGGAVLYASSMTGLYYIWYDDYEKSSFHWFNDNDEWLQIDKAGHFMAAYQISRISGEAWRWSGVSNRKSLLFSTGLSLLYLGGVELFDGFSAGWGASPGDLVANTVGAGLYAGQILLWNEERIIPKMSWHRTKYAACRPDLLGSGFSEVLKDYNGHTFWLSTSPGKWAKKSSFPPWLCFSLGYGAEGMTGGTVNFPSSYYSFERYRQFYFSMDADLTAIPVKKQWLRTVFGFLNMVKIPFPAVIYDSRGKFGFSPLHF